MLSPPPTVKLVALLLFTYLQFRIFRPEVFSVDCMGRSAVDTSPIIFPTAFTDAAAAIDPLLPHVSRSKIHQVSMRVYNATNQTKNALDDRCMATHLDYGVRWGYPTHILREDVRGKGQWRELLFSKPLYMLSLAVSEMAKPAGERAEWLVFFDSDTIILNPNIPWALFLPPSDFSDIHFIGGRDWGSGSRFNAGVFFVRINEWSVKMLAEVSALPDVRPDVQIGFNAEQSAFKWVFKQIGYREHVLYQPVEWFNGFEYSYDRLPPVQDGDMLIHFSGLKENKFGAVQKWLNRLERAPQELQIPLEDTNYQANIEAYWALLREARTTMQKAKDFTNGNYATHQEMLTALEELKQTIYDEADEPDFVIGAIDKVKSTLVAAEFRRMTQD